MADSGILIIPYRRNFVNLPLKENPPSAQSPGQGADWCVLDVFDNLICLFFLGRGRRLRRLKCYEKRVVEGASPLPYYGFRTHLLLFFRSPILYSAFSCLPLWGRGTIRRMVDEENGLQPPSVSGSSTGDILCTFLPLSAEKYQKNATKGLGALWTPVFPIWVCLTEEIHGHVSKSISAALAEILFSPRPNSTQGGRVPCLL